MHAMQYEIGLPADYDMGIIRRRVSERGHLLDATPGLGLKAYLVREVGVDASPVNEYAPFYLWNDPTAMARFLWGGGGFAGIVASFGRPQVRHWVGAAFCAGSGLDDEPVLATRRTERIEAHRDPADVVAAAAERARELATADRVHSVSVAVDPATWELVGLTLWAAGGDGAVTVGVDTYRVLHLSRPGLNALRGAV